MSTYGRRIGIRANDPDVLPLLFPYLPPDWKRSATPVVDRLYSVMTGSITGGESGAAPLVMIYQDTDIIAATDSIESAGELLEDDLQFYIAEAARNRVFVHAGVVGWKGRAILLPGRSLAGKTSLVVELVKAGAIYYSDEYAPLDRKGMVHPFARSLSIRESPTEKPLKQSAEDLGGRAGKKPLPVGLVVITEYVEGAHWRPRALSPGQGVLELMAHTIPARSQPEMVMAVLREVASSAIIVKTKRGAASETAARLLAEAERIRSAS